MMEKTCFLLSVISMLLLSVLSVLHVSARSFDEDFQERTLRVDYIFSGTATAQIISLDELCRLDGWAGRRTNMAAVPLLGNGDVRMADAASGDLLYATSFSTLFQEWQGTEEATRVQRSFENVFLLPMPKDSVRITVRLFNAKGRVSATFVHVVNPADILIRPLSPKVLPPHRYVHRGGRPDAIDVAIVAEGYTADEAEAFYGHAATLSQALLSAEPFRTYADRFNILAVALPSEESGVSIPERADWRNTALSSHFNTFYSSRYLTTLRLRQLHDKLAGLPYEHILILANTDNYGGGGIYNSYTLTTARHPMFAPVAVHEFGHSFGGLADEYYYDDQYTPMYFPDVEPWEQNITTLKDFRSKWADLLPEGTKTPTPPDSANLEKIGVYEGGGYQSKGVYRAFQDCRMKTNEAAAFCKVCQAALARIIRFYAPDISSETSSGANAE